MPKLGWHWPLLLVMGLLSNMFCTLAAVGSVQGVSEAAGVKLTLG